MANRSILKEMQSQSPMQPPKLRKLRWSLPQVDPQDLARKYVDSLQGASGVIEIRAGVAGSRLVLYTLVNRELSVEEEDRLYEAEADIHEASKDAEVDIRVVRQGSALPSGLGRAAVLYPTSA